MTPDLTRREHYASVALGALIPFHQQKYNLYDIGQNTEDCCGELAVAALRIADEMMLHLEIEAEPRSPAFSKSGKVIELPK